MYQILGKYSNCTRFSVSGKLKNVSDFFTTLRNCTRAKNARFLRWKKRECIQTNKGRLFENYLRIAEQKNKKTQGGGVLYMDILRKSLSSAQILNRFEFMKVRA